MNSLFWTQIRAIVRIEMKKTFFAKRGLWIYLLALAPVALFFTHSMVEIHEHGARRQMVQKSARQLTEQDFLSISIGMSREDVIARLGDPPVSRTRNRRMRTGRNSSVIVPTEILSYSDGNNELVLTLQNGALQAFGKPPASASARTVMYSPAFSSSSLSASRSSLAVSAFS